jgi:alpha-beta hydrolase superfamily lysophospholipase
MTTNSRPIEIPAADGTILRGDLYLPPAESPDAPVPGIVMSHGFSATRMMGLPWFAQRFCESGYAVALYDHRDIGTSGGSRRGHIDPWVQTRDMATVVRHLSRLDEVEASRLAVWGSSFSGGEAIVLGAMSDSVRAVVANAPFAGLGDLTDDEADVRFASMRAAFDDPDADIGTSVLGPMAVVCERPDQPAFLPQPESAEWFLAVGPPTGWTNSFTLSLSSDPPFDPAACASHLGGTALLMTVAAVDSVASTSVALDTFARASEPKRLEMVAGHHFTAYEPPARETVAAVMIAFLDEFV